MRATPNLYGPPRVGGDALSYCTKCRMDLAHVIVSMVDGKPSKVECKTCRSTHRFKATGGPIGGPPRTRNTAPKTVIRAAELWEQKLAKKTEADAAPYQTTRRFNTGDVVKHPNFGMGIVEEIRSPTKIAVLFRDGEKILVHGMS